MDMSLTTCWDCPPTFVESFVSLFVGLLLLLIAVALRANRYVVVRAFSTVIAFVAIVWLLLMAFASWRFGVAWEHDYRASAVLTMLFMVTPLVFLLAVGALAFRSRRRAS